MNEGNTEYVPPLTESQAVTVGRHTETAEIAELAFAHVDSLAETIVANFGTSAIVEGAKARLESLQRASASKLASRALDAVGDFVDARVKGQRGKAKRRLEKAAGFREKATVRKGEKVGVSADETKEGIAALETKARGTDRYLGPKTVARKTRALFGSLKRVFRRSPEGLVKKATRQEGGAGRHEVRANTLGNWANAFHHVATVARGGAPVSEALQRARKEARETTGLTPDTMTEAEIRANLAELTAELAVRAGEGNAEIVAQKVTSPLA